MRGTIKSDRLGTTNAYKYLQSFSAGGRDIPVWAWLRWGQCGAGLHPRKAKLLPGSTAAHTECWPVEGQGWPCHAVRDSPWLWQG